MPSGSKKRKAAKKKKEQETHNGTSNPPPPQGSNDVNSQYKDAEAIQKDGIERELKDNFVSKDVVIEDAKSAKGRCGRTKKWWNVNNFDNREKVRQDEKAAAKEEQLKREQSQKRDTEFRLEQLRTTRGLSPVSQGKEPAAVESNPAVVESKYAAVESKPGYINLFEGIKIFDPNKGLENEGGDGKDGFKKNKKMKKEEAKLKVVTAKDEKYRLGYGAAGKGVKLPWYLGRLSADANEESAEDDESSSADKEKKNKSGKKTLHIRR